MKEYKVEKSSGTFFLDSEMNRMAKEGWEVLTVISYGTSNSDFLVTYVREKPEYGW